jgi:outer membrane immunogenic protein
MKRAFLTIVLLIATTMIFAQCPIEIGQSQFNAGIGSSSWGNPIYLGLDYGIHKDITIGGEFSLRSFHDNWSGRKYNHSVIGIAGNGNYHFNSLLDIPSNWDFYAGLHLGFYIWNSPDNYAGSHSSGFGLGGQVGGRYYFSKKFGINLEFDGGSASSGGKLGVSIRF